MSRNIIIKNDNDSTPLQCGMEALGIRFVHNEWTPNPDLLQQTLACFIRFYDCIHHPIRVLRLKRYLTRHKIPLIAWNKDAPHYLNFAIPTRKWRLYLIDKIRPFDIYATHTLIDQQRMFADLILYLPNAANIDHYHLHGDAGTVLSCLRDSTTYRYDVSFFGGMDGHRYKEDYAREDFFAALAKRLDEKGISYKFIDTCNNKMSLEDHIELIQSSRINLNFGARCEYNAPVASGLPERCYGIPACGGFLLCDKRTHARDDFTIGENWAEFDGLDNCVEQIEYWLADFDKARDLAERCHVYVMNNHTYAHRAEKMLNAVYAWHEGNRGVII